MNDLSSRRFVLRDLPLAARVVIAFFLVSVGAGYGAALVQIHFQQARPGELLPNGDDLVRTFSGEQGHRQSKIEQLLTADESHPFTGQGTMRVAFTTKSESWKSAIKETAKELKIKDLTKAEQALRHQREGEIDAVLAWVRAGAPKQDYEKDHFVLPADLAKREITSDYLVTDDKGKLAEPEAFKIKTLFNDRCVRCHDPEKQGEKAAQFPLNTYEHIKQYTQVTASGGGMSLTKLAQSTHLHLLSFAMLYGLTGLIFSLTSYAGWVRMLIGPWPLVLQLAEISCWWLARMDPQYARAIGVLGGLVALGLMLQIVLTLFGLFGKTGKVVLVALVCVALAGGYMVKQRVIEPYLAQEGNSAQQ